MGELEEEKEIPLDNSPESSNPFGFKSESEESYTDSLLEQEFDPAPNYKQKLIFNTDKKKGVIKSANGYNSESDSYGSWNEEKYNLSDYEFNEFCPSKGQQIN